MLKPKKAKVKKPVPAAVIVPRDQHIISRQHISDYALKVLYRLHAAGYQAYLVGGGVRDLLLECNPKDFDIATDARPEEVRRIFRNCRLIGRRFRLAHILFGHEIIEVATFRAGHEDVRDQQKAHVRDGMIVRDNVYGTLEEDAFRRDFTINALYYNIADFSILDYTHGLEDLHKRQLRMIGNPLQRYQEDPVRMLRAIRLAAKLDFTVEPETAAPLREQVSLLESVSNSRLFEEFLKLFLNGSALKTYQLLNEYGFFQYLFPFTVAACEGVYAEQAQALLIQTFQNTDERVLADKPVTPAFLLASLLWYPLKESIDKYQAEMAPGAALELAMNELLQQQCKIIAIPKRCTLMMREIWILQQRLHRRLNGYAQRVFSHPRFRAAYDFLVLRAQVGENVHGLADWWTDYQMATPEVQSTLLHQLQVQQRKSKKSAAPAQIPPANNVADTE